jgi:phosphoenolpyruvate carboxylase
VPSDAAGLVWLRLRSTAIWANPEGLTTLRRMVKSWPFFQSLLSNMDMVLAKTDLAIASRYAELVTDAELRERIFTHQGRMGTDQKASAGHS